MAIGFTEVEGGIQADAAVTVLAWGVVWGIGVEDENPTEVAIALTVNGTYVAETYNNSGYDDTLTGVLTNGARLIPLEAGDVLGIRFYANQPCSPDFAQIVVGEAVIQTDLGDGPEGAWAFVGSFINGAYFLNLYDQPYSPVPFDTDQLDGSNGVGLLSTYSGSLEWIRRDGIWPAISQAVQAQSGDADLVLRGDGSIGAVLGAPNVVGTILINGLSTPAANSGAGYVVGGDALTGGVFASCSGPSLAAPTGGVVALNQIDYELQGQVDAASDSFDIDFVVYVTDAAGANTASCSFALSLPSPVTSLFAEGSLSGGAWSITGSDLSASGDTLVTAAGGNYTVYVTLNGSWD